MKVIYFNIFFILCEKTVFLLFQKFLDRVTEVKLQFLNYYAALWRLLYTDFIKKKFRKIKTNWEKD